MRPVGEITLAESDDKEISCNDVVDIAILIAQRTVERQTIQLAILVPDLMLLMIEDAPSCLSVHSLARFTELCKRGT